jgi:hypothetical protein
MLITTSNDTSERLNHSHVSLLRNECDDVKTFTECGWFCVTGYKGNKRLVYAHCNSFEEYETAMGLLRRSNPFDYGGESGYLIKATATYSVDEEKTDEAAAFFSSADPYTDRERITELAGETLREAVDGETLREAVDGETRTIRLQREYWDQLPRSERAVSVEEDARPSFR